MVYILILDLLMQIDMFVYIHLEVVCLHVSAMNFKPTNKLRRRQRFIILPTFLCMQS